MDLLTRIRVFKAGMFILLSVLLISLFKIQVINGEFYRKRSEHNRIRLIPIKSTRGRILDRYGKVIADNRPSFNLYVIPEDFYFESTEKLSSIIDIAQEDIKSKITKSTNPDFVPILLKSDLSRTELCEIEEQSLDFGGVFVDVFGTRYYPYGEVASHTIGYLGKINRKEYNEKNPMGYLIDDYIGRAGIEKLFEEVLRGEHGGKQIEVNARGQETGVLAYRRPFPGSDITLSLDIELESAIYNILGNDTASVSVMDIKNGEILALVSTPGYDPNAFVTPSRSTERMALFKDEDLPFLNRTISSRYPPGSIFKLVTALAALDAGVITENTVVHCSGEYQLTPTSRAFHCWSKIGHGDVTLTKAIERSCNIYFYHVGRMLGAERLAKFTKKLGLGEPVRIELPQAARGLIPDPLWKKQKLNEQWYQGETLNYAIGQGYLAVTPAQILRLVAIIANNGEIVEPSIIKGVSHHPNVLAINERHIKLVKNGMLKAVQAAYGTGHRASVDFFEVAGKTGTAQTTGESHAWFAGFFPYDDPKIALVVMVEHGGVGGRKAAGIAHDIFVEWHKMMEANEAV